MTTLEIIFVLISALLMGTISMFVILIIFQISFIVFCAIFFTIIDIIFGSYILWGTDGNSMLH